MKNYIRFTEFFRNMQSDFIAKGFDNIAYHYDRSQYAKIGVIDEQKIIALEHRKSKEIIDRISMSLSLVGEYGSLYEVEEDVMRYICMNHPPPKDVIKKLRLPFRSIFVETEITRKDFEELGMDRVGGMLICETEFISSAHSLEGDKLKYNNLGRCFLVYVYCEDNQKYWIDEFKIVVDELGTDIKIIYQNKDTMKFLRSFLMNFILFINDPEVENVVHKREGKNVERRIKMRKPVLPSSRRVKIVGKLKVYMDGMRQSLSGSGFSFRFWVRGHCRTLRSDRYKESKGRVIFISPFMKGQGLLLKREYELDMQSDDIRRRDL